MAKKVTAVVVAILVFSIVQVRAANSATEALTTLIESSLQNNPDLQAVFFNWQASREAIVHKTALPDPQINFRHNIEPIQTRTGEQDQVLTISQMLPYPGKQKTAVRLNHQMSENARIKYEVRLRDLITDIKKTFAEIWFLSAAMRATEKNRELVELLNRNINSIQPASTLMPVIKVQSQQAQNANDLIRYSELLAAQKARLIALTGIETLPQEWFTQLPRHVFPSDEANLLEQALSRKLEIQAAKNSSRIAATGIRMARYDSRPDFMVGYSRAFTGHRPDLSGPDIPGEGKDSVGVFVQMNLPVWGAKNRSRMQEAVQKKREADAQVAAEQNKIRADFSELFFTLANRRRLVEIYRDTILPQAKTAMESANAFFQNDSSNFADYLETASTFYALQIAALRAEADLFSSAADLEKFVGMPFELTESAGQK